MIRDSAVLDATLYEACETYHQSPPLAFALIKAMSHWNVFMSQVMNTSRDFFPKHTVPGISPDTEVIHQRTRWGLFQILGSEARRVGYTGWLSSLMEPEVNISWGVRFLATTTLAHRGESVIHRFCGHNLQNPTQEEINFASKVRKYEREYMQR